MFGQRSKVAGLCDQYSLSSYLADVIRMTSSSAHLVVNTSFSQYSRTPVIKVDKEATVAPLITTYKVYTQRACDPPGPAMLALCATQKHGWRTKY